MLMAHQMAGDSKWLARQSVDLNNYLNWLRSTAFFTLIYWTYYEILGSYIVLHPLKYCFYYNTEWKIVICSVYVNFINLAICLQFRSE